MWGSNSWGARVPLAGLGVGCFAGILCAEAGLPFWAQAGVAAAGVGWAWRIRSVRLGLLFVGWLALGGVHAARLATQAVLAQRLAGETPVSLVVEVVDVTDEGYFQPGVVVEVREGAGAGGRVGVRSFPGPVRPGDRFRLTGELREVERPRNPGELDRQGWMRRAGLAGEVFVVRADPLPGVSWSLWPRRVARDLHGVVRDRIGRGLDQEGTPVFLIRALVLGERDADQVEAFAAFRNSGTIHVFSVSGLHVAMVGMLAWGLLRPFRIPRGWGVWIVLFVMWQYALVTGLRPPAMRSALMASVYLAGFLVRRAPGLGNALLASLPPVLLADSFQWQQPGFQLSYGVVASIILLAPAGHRLLKPWLGGDPFLPRVLYTWRQEFRRLAREKTGGLLVVSCSAWLGSLPLMWWHFGLITPSAIFASLILVPVSFAILGLAMISLLAGLVWEPAGVALNRVNGAVTSGALIVARGFAAVPGSYFQIPKETWWGDGLVVFDLRDGDGAAFFGAGRGVLLDCGGAGEFGRVVYPALRDGVVTPDALVISHPDGGHCGGGAGTVRGWPVGQVLLPVDEALSPSFRALRKAAEEEGARIVRAATGSRFPLADGAELEVVYAADRWEGSLADDRSMVLRLHWHGWRILLSGDAGFETEQRILERGIDVRSDVWIMGRNRADSTGGSLFVEAVSPAIIVASDHDFPVEERVPESWAKEIAAKGIVLWKQSHTGAVAVEADAERLELRSYLEPDRREVLKRP